MPDPQRLLRLETALILGLDQSPGLSPRQSREWARANRDPATTWEVVAPLPIEHPWVALLVAPLLDEIGEAHGDSPAQARALRAAVSQVATGVRRVQALLATRGRSVIGGWSRGRPPWRVESLHHLLALENAVGAAAIRSPEITAFCVTLERWARCLAPIAQVNAFHPPRGKTRRYRPWRGAAQRLDLFLRGSPDHPRHFGHYAALVAGLEWHGIDIGPGSLELKVARVKRVLGGDRPRRARRA